jgi:asparagine synthase (glutamine-hydrolysing)
VCGIFGYVLDRSAGPPPSLERAIDCLRHRGPEGEGTFRDAVSDPVCGLAHSRLAIIDLSEGGRQPMSTADGRFTVVNNGEIYNYREIRKELEASGVRVHTESDTEAILHVYAQWGKAGLDRLRGMFAFAIWDARERTLFLARDRLGVKPLYVARTAGGVVFASELRALLSTGLVAPKLDAQALEGYLAFGSTREPRTIVRGVELLPSGGYAELRDGRWTEGLYWTPPLHTDRTVSREDAVAETRSLLQESIALRLVADVPVSVFLSGGVDSSAILALASMESKQPLHAFTIGLEEWSLDETAHARTVASRFGAEHHVVLLAAKRIAEDIDDAMAALDQPSADGVNTYFVAKAVKTAGFPVALSGIGGDELFAGYPRFRTFRNVMRLRPLLAGAPSQAAHWATGALPGGRRSVRTQKALDLLATKGDPFGVYTVFRRVFSAGEIEGLLGRAPAEGLEANALDRDISGWTRTDQEAVTAYSLFELTNYLRNTLLRDTDIMSMAHALEVREPLLDHRLVERLLVYPDSFKLARGVNKPLLVAAVSELPAPTVQRPKMGFTLPFDAWLRGPLREWAERKLASAEEVGLSASAVRGVWQAFLEGRLSFSRVWALVALIDWCKRHGVSP